MSRILTVLALLALPTTALADRGDADACAKGLGEPSISIYKYGIVKVESGSTLEQAVRPYLEPRVRNKKMTEAEARKYGREAAECLRLVHRREELPPP